MTYLVEYVDAVLSIVKYAKTNVELFPRTNGVVSIGGVEYLSMEILDNLREDLHQGEKEQRKRMKMRISNVFSGRVLAVNQVMFQASKQVKGLDPHLNRCLRSYLPPIVYPTASSALEWNIPGFSMEEIYSSDDDDDDDEESHHETVLLKQHESPHKETFRCIGIVLNDVKFALIYAIPPADDKEYILLRRLVAEHDAVIQRLTFIVSRLQS